MNDPKKYRTELPNIIDDLGLSPYERALYAHYKRVCGGLEGGECREGIRTTSEHTRIARSCIATIRNSLADRELIHCQAGHVGRNGVTTITIVDIWELNSAYYIDRDRPNIDGWTITQLKEYFQQHSSDPVGHPGNQNVLQDQVNDEGPSDGQLPVEMSATRTEMSATRTECPPHGQKCPSDGPLPVEMSATRTEMSVGRTITGRNVRHTDGMSATRTEMSVGRTEEGTMKKEPIKNLREGDPVSWGAVAQMPAISPAFKIYAEESHCFALKKPQIMAIHQAVGEDSTNLERWRQVVAAWILTGYSPVNARGMLDWFQNGIPERKNGQYGEKSTRSGPGGGYNGYRRPTGAELKQKPWYDIQTKELVYPDGHRELLL